MGSKSQIALPDLDEDQVAEETLSAARPVNSRDQKSAPQGKADIIPAFLPAGRLNLRDVGEEPVRQEPEEAPGEEEEEDDLPVAALGSEGDDAISAGTGATAALHNIDDPELIELLEQLSATIDNANQMLSEAPPLRGPVADEYAAAGAASEPVMPPPNVAVERPSRSGSVTALVLSGLFLCTAAGGYWWFKTNPWLLDETQNNALSITRDGGVAASPAQESVAAKLPEAPRAVPIPERAAARERMTASLAPSPIAPVQPMNTDGGKAGIAAAAEPGPVHGTAGSPMDIALVLPDKADGQEISVMVQGVPKDVTLSSGSFIGGGTWVLTEQEAANLVLNTPASFPAQDFSLDVAFVKSDGKVPESRKIAVVVDPAQDPVTPATHGLAAGEPGTASPAPAPADVAAPGPASAGVAGFEDKAEPEEKTDANTAFSTPPASAIASAEEKKLLSRGQELMGLGDVASARLIFAHAARLGSTAAMMELGKTFDPDYLAKLGVRGVQPDKAQATAWYQRASRKADR